MVEPKDHHLYQPLFSHIAGGRAKASEAVRTQASVLPRGVEWIWDSAVGIDPASNTVALASGAQVGFGQLVVCPGLQLDWDTIPGPGRGRPFPLRRVPLRIQIWRPRPGRCSAA